MPEATASSPSPAPPDSDPAPTRLLADRRLWLMGAYGFFSGLPLPLSGFTFRLWLSDGGVSLALIGLTANVGLAYSLKFLWAPLLDQTRPPGPLARLGRRRGWLAAIQPALALAALLLALARPEAAPAGAVAAALAARSTATISIAVSTASAPLLPSSPPARAIACSRFSVVSTPKATGIPVSSWTRWQPAAHSLATIS